MISLFERTLLDELRSIREQLAEANIPVMRLDIEVSGRTHDGDLEIVFKLSKDSYNTVGHTAGGSLDAVVDEFIRRHGWSQRHAALCLPSIAPAPAPEHPELNDEIPF